MKLLVTGGAGFIGSNFIHYMLKEHEDCEIVNVDLLTYAGNLSSLEDVCEDARYRFYKGDIADPKFIDGVFEEEKVDVVVNFAAESHVDRSIENPDIFLHTNVLGTNTLLKAASKYGVGRFHQISTDEVYGDLPLERKDLLFTESTPLHASSPYSASKASADILALAYYRTYGLPVTISRCSNNYGPYQFPEKLIPLMFIKAMKEEKLPVYGDGKNVRDWLYVEDHCRAIDRILQSDKAGEVYNIGGMNEISNIDMVKGILSYLGKSEDLIEYVKDRPGHDRRYAINPEKIGQELGWKPEYDIKRGMAVTLDWYKEHKEWWEKLCK